MEYPFKRTGFISYSTFRPTPFLSSSLNFHSMKIRSYRFINPSLKICYDIRFEDYNKKIHFTS